MGSVINERQEEYVNLKIAMAGAGAASLLVLAGCSTSTEEAAENTQTDNAAVCQALADMKTQMDQIEAAADVKVDSGETITVDDTKAALSALQDSYDEVEDAAENLNSSVAQQFELAQDAYQDQLDTITDDQALSSASAEVQAARTALLSSYNEILSGLGC